MSRRANQKKNADYDDMKKGIIQQDFLNYGVVVDFVLLFIPIFTKRGRRPIHKAWSASWV